MSSTTLVATGGWAGVDSVWEQEKLEAGKMLENRAESPPPAARFVWRFWVAQDSPPEKTMPPM